ncbi:MAG: carboxypeptidase-like regulatory domain-containing protein [Vicinamibacterales bacterium]
MNRLTSSRRWGLSIALLAMPVWAAAQPVGVTTQPPVIPTQPPRDRLPQTQRVGTAVLKGRVVDGASSAPVPRARVRLLGPAGSRPPVLTDAEGAFELSALPSGTYSLQVEKSTYLTGRYPDAGRSIRARSTPLILRDGQVVENFTIPLFHGGAISGRVFDAHGDPVDMAQVRALRISRGGRPTMAGQMQSNDLGESRIPRLQPGRYMIQVRPQMPQSFFSPDPSVIELPLAQPLPTYYPSALALSQATPVTVNRGETLTGIDLTLAEGTPTLVTGTVLRPDGQPAGNGSITARVMGSEANVGFDSGGGTGIRPGGEFRLTPAWSSKARRRHRRVPERSAYRSSIPTDLAADPPRQRLPPTGPSRSKASAALAGRHPRPCSAAGR